MYLIFRDFKRLIQTDNLMQVLGQDLSILDNVSQTAQEEATSYLIQKFDISAELTDTSPYNPSKQYLAGDRVYLDAPVYNPLAIYDLFTLVLQNGYVYFCSTAITTPEAFTIAHWTLLGAQYTIFYAPYPQPIFNYKNIYKTSDKVFWKNKVYTAILGTIGVDYDTRIQNNDATYPNIINVFPDDPVKGIKYWGSGVDYVVPPSTLYAITGIYAPQYFETLQEQYTAIADISIISLPALIGNNIVQITSEIKPLLFSQYSWNKNTAILTLIGNSLITGQTLFILYSNAVSGNNVISYWVQGDNRSQQMVTTLIDIALYHLHKRIAPRNIPDLRVKAYDDSINWLKKVMKGDITPNLAVKQPDQGSRIRWASVQKQQNGY